MTRTIQKILGTIVGITAFVFAYYWTLPLLEYLLQWLAGDPVVYQDVYRGFGGSPFIFVLRILTGAYLGILGWRYSQKFFERFVIPGLSKSADEIANKSLTVRVFVNCPDDQGQLQRLELFAQEMSAESLFRFFWSGEGKPLLLRGKPGVYLQLAVAPKSPYFSEGQSPEDVYAVKVRTRKHILHNFESVFGKQPTFTIQDGKSLAYYRLALDYVGSQTDSHGMLVITGDKRVMEKVFFAPKNRSQSAASATLASA